MDDLQRMMIKDLQDPDFAAAYRDAESRSALHDKLVNLRLASARTVEEVAKHMGVKPERVRDYEAHRRDALWGMHQRYARAVGHRLMWAIGVSDAEPAAD